MPAINFPKCFPREREKKKQNKNICILHSTSQMIVRMCLNIVVFSISRPQNIKCHNKITRIYCGCRGENSPNFNRIALHWWWFHSEHVRLKIESNSRTQACAMWRGARYSWFLLCHVFLMCRAVWLMLLFTKHFNIIVNALRFHIYSVRIIHCWLDCG